jgi:phage gp29-like protein
MARSSPVSKVSAERAKLFKLQYANPISGLTPQKLVTYLNAFNRGELRSAALLWREIIERDDQVKTCAGKRGRGVAGLDWEILPIDDSPAAAAHKDALEYFYNNLCAYDGLNEMERGGIRQLFRQMMSAVGMRYAMHEIIWKPQGGGKISADFKFLPLQFFENKTGKLRFLPTDHVLDGVPLDDQFGEYGWMCNCGEGLMVATSIAYIMKTPTGLKAWVTYMEKFGIPGLHAKTSAAKDSPEWDALVEALEGFGEDLALVTNEGASITPLELKSAAQAPHQPLVDRMDRGISRLWMGGDLATMSAGNQAVGAQGQGDDLDQLKKDDAEMITDALQYYVDRAVVAQLFGEGVAPLAYFKLKPPAKVDVERELKIDQTLVGWGVEVGKSDLRARYGRAEPDAGDEIAKAPAAPFQPFGNAPAETRQRAGQGDLTAFNERKLRPALNERDAAFRLAALEKLGRAQAEHFAPLRKRLEQILAIEDEAQQRTALERFKAGIPEYIKSLKPDSPLVKTYEAIFGSALVSGAAESAKATQ